MTSQTNTMPQDRLCEQFVLGAMLNSIDAINLCLPQLDVTDFYFSESQAIFQAISKLYKSNHSVNAENIALELKNNKAIPWQTILNYSVQGTAIDANYYLSTLLNTSRLRKTIMASQQAIVGAHKQDSDSLEVIADLQNKLFNIQGLGFEETKNPEELLTDFHEGKSFQEHTLWAFDEVRQGRLPYTGVSTGYQALDKTLGFLRPGCYYTIGARTSMGKTTFLLNLIKNMNFLGRETPLGFFSLEMPAKIITAKLICMYAGVQYRKFDDCCCSIDDLQSILTYAEMLKKAPIFIEDQSGITISMLRARAKRMLQNHKIKVLFIDYLTLIKPDGKHSNNHLAINEVSKGIQNLAKELNIPIVVLAQLNRAVTGRTNNKPTLADFRESGSIEEDSDACLMLHRPEYYDPNDKPGVSQLFVAKNRIRGEIRKIEFHTPSGEVYQELTAIQEETQKITTNNYFESHRHE